MGNRVLCSRFLEAMASNDSAGMDALIHPEFVLIEPQGLPYGGVYKGREGWRTLVNRVIETWASFRIQISEELGETEDTLVTRFDISGRSRRTGREWTSSVLELWRFRDGLIVEIVPYYFDTHLLAVIDQ
jgi:ketosteroid isomerase-like protein